MGSQTVASWLESAGLRRYVPNFGAVTENIFLSLQMTDYEKFGVTAIDDKQRLFRLIKKMSKSYKEPGPTSRDNGNYYQNMSNCNHSLAPGNSPFGSYTFSQNEADSGLLNLDDEDCDLLDEAQGANLDVLRAESIASLPNITKTTAQQAYNPPKIRVIVRKRPINKKEREKGEEDIISINMEKGELLVNEPKVRVDLTKYTETHQFVFDDALNETVTNDDVFQATVQPLVRTLFYGGKATCFAYGQTGSGKTYTMTPLPLKAASDIFNHLRLPENRGFNLFVSCFEIYGGKIFDLLNNRKKLEIREDAKKRVVVVGLKEYLTTNLEYIVQLTSRASSARSTGTTGANTDSSRSHSVMQFAIKRGNKDKSPLVGKISFIDLAGSERGADTFDNNRQTRLEGAEINKSLLALKECIRALDNDARHVPFRGSKLTAVLRDSFVGKEARTVMIANVSPNSLSVEHSLNTLRYADRVKELRKEKGERSPSLVTPGMLLPSGYSNTTITEVKKNDNDDDEMDTDIPMQPAQLLPPLQQNPSQSNLRESITSLKNESNNFIQYESTPEQSTLHHKRSLSREKYPGSDIDDNMNMSNMNGNTNSNFIGESYSTNNNNNNNNSVSRPSTTSTYKQHQDYTTMLPSSMISNFEFSPQQPSYHSTTLTKSSSLKDQRKFIGRENLMENGLKKKYSCEINENIEKSPFSKNGSVKKSFGTNNASSLNVASKEHRDLVAEHEDVMNAILDEEEIVICGHRMMIENMMDLVKEEMDMLTEVDQPGSAIDRYVERLDELLIAKRQMIDDLQGKVTEFKAKLKQEEYLSVMIGNFKENGN